VPHELDMVKLPPYMIEPPDVLLVDVIRLVPRPPYRIEPLDSILIQWNNVRPDGTVEPISNLYVVGPDGAVNLGFTYGPVRVTGMTLEQARVAVEQYLKTKGLKVPDVRVDLGQSAGIQLIRGEHLVRPDGTVGLGLYGSVDVTGLTLTQARQAIEAHLSAFFVDPQVSLDIYVYNSKFYYVIADGAGYGQQILRFHTTGKETVLDAITQISGLPPVSSKHKIWVARPNGSDPCKEQILPVDWCALTMGGSPLTNYQVMPGDRIYIQSQALIRTNNTLAKVLAPIERVLGITLLGASTVAEIQQIDLAPRAIKAGNAVITTNGGR
jgi:polysaccharide export outer membrane protein